MIAESIVWLSLVLTTVLLVTACRESGQPPAVMFVDKGGPAGSGLPSLETNLLLLTAAIDAEGELTLNQIGVGTIDDTTILQEKLQTIFEDREKASISEKEVLIEMEGSVTHDDLQKLIAALTDAGASPINVIKR